MKRRIGGLRYKIEVASTKLKCYITLQKSGEYQMLWLWARQALKMIQSITKDCFATDFS
jgi:hypothetical protein